jgi:hypothetical protein
MSRIAHSTACRENIDAQGYGNGMVEVLQVLG